MSNYHKLEAKVVQELKDIANKIRIDSVSSTQAAKSGWVENFMFYFEKRGLVSMFYMIINDILFNKFSHLETRYKGNVPLRH